MLAKAGPWFGASRSCLTACLLFVASLMAVNSSIADDSQPVSLGECVSVGGGTPADCPAGCVCGECVGCVRTDGAVELLSKGPEREVPVLVIECKNCPVDCPCSDVLPIECEAERSVSATETQSRTINGSIEVDGWIIDARFGAAFGWSDSRAIMETITCGPTEAPPCWLWRGHVAVLRQVYVYRIDHVWSCEYDSLTCGDHPVGSYVTTCGTGRSYATIDKVIGFSCVTDKSKHCKRKG